MARLALFLSSVCGVLAVVHGIIVHPCVIADIMYGEMGVRKSTVAHWICLAKFASGFNTQALGQRHSDGSDDFGLFQINDRYCRRGTTHSCGVNCTELVRDDIRSSIRCAMWIHRKEGFDHWSSWRNNCKGKKDVQRHIEKCSLQKSRSG